MLQCLKFCSRRTLAFFRYSRHDLKIETGRQEVLDCVHYVCVEMSTLLKMKCTFLIDYPVYNELRIRYLDYNVWKSIGNSDKSFQIIMSDFQIASVLCFG